MARRRNKLTVKDVDAGATDAYIITPVGLTVDLIMIKRTNCTAAQMTNIRVQAGNDIFQRFRDAAELEAYNKHFNRYSDAANGYDFIYFVRPEMASYQDRRLTAFGTQDLNQARVLFDVDAAATGAAVEAWAIRSPAQPAGLVTRIQSFKENFGSSGEHSFDNIHKSVSGRLVALHLFDASLTSARLDVDTVPVWELDADDAAKLAQTSPQGRTPQTSWCVLDFVEEGNPLTALTMAGVSESRLTVDLSAGGDVLGLRETLDGIRKVGGSV